MRFVLFASLLLFAGCRIDNKPSALDWMDAPETHTCNNEQFSVVQSQTEACKNITEYSDNYCYGVAIMAHCTKRPTTPTNTDGE